MTALSKQKADFWILVAIVLCGIALRFAFFTGLSLGDDVFYQLQAVAHAIGHTWPPEPYHWQTRLGVTGPAALSILLFGLKPLAFVLWPFVASLAAIVICYYVAGDFVAPKVALLAALFQAVFPMDVIYSTHLFPNIEMAVFASLSIWLWIRGLRTDSRRAFFFSGLCLGIAYLCHETVLMLGPTYLALWLAIGRWRRPQIGWAVLAPVVIVMAEAIVYRTSTGTAMYRVLAIASEQRSPQQLALVFSSSAGGGFWTDPLLMLITSHEFAMYHVAALLLLPYAWVRWPATRLLVIWWSVTFAWYYYGTTVPYVYVPLFRDPRYVSVMTIPACTLMAQFVASRSRAQGYLMATVVVTTAILAAGLDQGNAALIPLSKYARSPYVNNATLEPFEYFGARWSMGLDQPVQFMCATDLGRDAVLHMLQSLPGTTVTAASGSRFVVFSSQRRPDLMAKMTPGWTQVAYFAGEVPWARRWIAGIFSMIPSQRERANGILRPPGVAVFMNPNPQG